MASNKGKKILKYILSLSLAAVLLWFSFREVEWTDFILSLKNCRWELILLSMAAGAFAFLLRALRWRMLMLPIDRSVSRLTAFNGVCIGNISNFVFPRLGEFVRCGVIVRRSSISYDKVLGTVVLERGWELLVMLLMLAVVVAGGYERFGDFFMTQIYIPVSERINFSLWWLVGLFGILAAASIFLVWKKRNDNALCGRIWGFVRGLYDGFSSCLKMEHKWLFFAYTLLIWGTYWLMAALTVRSVPFLEHLNAVDALFLSLVGGVGFAVPVPGGIGAFHFVIGLALAGIYDVPMETGVVYATLSHTSQAVTQIVSGLGSYICEAFRK